MCIYVVVLTFFSTFSYTHTIYMRTHTKYTHVWFVLCSRVYLYTCTTTTDRIRFLYNSKTLSRAAQGFQISRQGTRDNPQTYITHDCSNGYIRRRAEIRLIIFNIVIYTTRAGVQGVPIIPICGYMWRQRKGFLNALKKKRKILKKKYECMHRNFFF